MNGKLWKIIIIDYTHFFFHAKLNDALHISNIEQKHDSSHINTF